MSNTPHQTPLLTTHSLAIGYPPAAPVATELTLSLTPGELVALVGPNGAGKSTLLRSLAGLHPVIAGEVRIDDQQVGAITGTALARLRALVLTDRVDAVGFTVRELVALGRLPHTGWFGGLRSADESAVHAAIEQVGATELAERPIAELSDGERQRVMIARALAQEPRLLILDEPTAFLDLPHRVSVILLLRRLAHERGIGVLLSTHELDLAMRCADQLWLMPGDGALHAGAPEDLAISGVLARTFASESLSFDAASGSFTLQRQGAANCQVIGEGDHAEWTRRAVERLGYQVTLGEAAIRIDVQPDHWLVDGDRVESITELAARLRQ